jgi:hypothetical protein
LALIAVVVATVIGWPAPASAARHRTHYYVIGDSVTAWSATALRRELARTRPGALIDGQPCRGAVVSCALWDWQARPASGLAVIRSKRGELGKLVVIELGYNDTPGARSIDRIMRELHAQHVRRVVWVNLSERHRAYRATNRALAAATKRWPELRVLDWRDASAHHDDWFIDSVHLSRSGRTAFARFVARGLARVA